MHKKNAKNRHPAAVNSDREQNLERSASSARHCFDTDHAEDCRKIQLGLSTEIFEARSAAVNRDWWNTQRERSLATAASTGAYKIYKRSPYKLIRATIINL